MSATPMRGPWTVAASSTMRCISTRTQASPETLCPETASATSAARSGSISAHVMRAVKRVVPIAVWRPIDSLAGPEDENVMAVHIQQKLG